MLSERFFQDQDALTQALVTDLIMSVESGLQMKNQFVLAVSGGRTPKPVYQKLSEQKLDWNRIRVSLVDERWVEEGHEASNAGFVKQYLLQNLAQAAVFTGMKNTARTAKSGQAECEAQYQLYAPVADVMILGMGEDGHTASLFPHAEGLEAAMSQTDLCAAITAHKSKITAQYTERMSLTFHAIVQSRQIVLLITGEKKRRLYESLQQAEPDYLTYPVQAVLQQKWAPVTVYWAPEE